MLLRNKNLLFNLALISFLIVFLMPSCEKAANPTVPSPTPKLELYLTDAPGPYDAALLDIRKVMVRIDTSNSQNTDAGTWQELPIVHAGLFNLLSLRNGNDTLLASGNVASGILREISLTLGRNSKVCLNNGVTTELKCPDSLHSDAMLILDGGSRTTGEGETYHLVLDFDVSRSIIPTTSPTDSSHTIYMFVPYTRAFSKEAGGAIQGWVFPEAALSTVMAISDKHDTITTQPDPNGYYKLWGLPEGAYTIRYLPDPSTGYQSVTESNIQITSGQLIVNDTVRLHQ